MYTTSMPVTLATRRLWASGAEEADVFNKLAEDFHSITGDIPENVLSVQIGDVTMTSHNGKLVAHQVITWTTPRQP